MRREPFRVRLWVLYARSLSGLECFFWPPEKRHKKTVFFAVRGLAMRRQRASREVTPSMSAIAVKMLERALNPKCLVRGFLDSLARHCESLGQLHHGIPGGADFRSAAVEFPFGRRKVDEAAALLVLPNVLQPGSPYAHSRGGQVTGSRAAAPFRKGFSRCARFSGENRGISTG